MADHPECIIFFGVAFGRFFEVTRDGEIVWEYVNPLFGGPPHAETNEVFRALRYSAEEFAQAEATASGENLTFDTHRLGLESTEAV